MTLSDVLKTLSLCASLRDRKVKLYDTHLHVKDYEASEDENLLTKEVVYFEYERYLNEVAISIKTDFSKASKNFKSIAYS